MILCIHLFYLLSSMPSPPSHILCQGPWQGCESSQIMAHFTSWKKLINADVKCMMQRWPATSSTGKEAMSVLSFFVFIADDVVNKLITKDQAHQWQASKWCQRVVTVVNFVADIQHWQARLHKRCQPTVKVSLRPLPLTSYLAYGRSNCTHFDTGCIVAK